MSRKLQWSESAVQDLEDIAEYIARDDPRQAASWIARLQLRARQAALFPVSGRVGAEFGREDIREFVLRDHRIVYRVMPRRCVVLTVFERHRRLRGPL